MSTGEHQVEAEVDADRSGEVDRSNDPEVAAAVPLDPEATAFVQTIDFRYQRLFGQVSLWTLLVWAGVVAAAWTLMGWGATVGLLAVGCALLGLFAMRTAVHLRSARLTREVEQFQARHHLTLEALLRHAKGMSPPAEFFTSLMDGPLARARRDRRQAAARS